MTDKEKASELAIKLEGEIGTSPHSRLAIEEAFLAFAIVYIAGRLAVSLIFNI